MGTKKIKTVIVENLQQHQFQIDAVKQKGSDKKCRLFLDMDGTLVAMKFVHPFKADSIWESKHRTEFCHWLNSIYPVLNRYCYKIYVLTNYTAENEKKAKVEWLKNNLKLKFNLILNKEGIPKSLYVSNKNDILVDDTLGNLAKWQDAGGTQYAFQYVCCEKGRRELLELIMNSNKKAK